MAHPYQEHRAHLHEKARVGHITRGYAGGGAVHGDEAEDEKLIRKEVKPSALKRARGGKIDGKAAVARLDRPGRAHGGKVKGKKGSTNVNVIVAPHPGAGAAPAGPPPGIGAAAPMPVPPPRPPMAPPGMAGPGMPPGGPPPGGPPMLRAKGGRVTDGPAWKEGLRNGTKVQHSSDKGTEQANDARMKKERKEYNYRTGGKVKGVSVDERPPIKVGDMGLSGTKEKSSPFPKMKHAAGGGLGRLEKERKAVRGVSAP